MTIEQRCFGNTGLKVGVLGLGTWELGFSKTNDNTVGSILDAAADAGINVLDSAAMYGDADLPQTAKTLSSRGREPTMLIA